MALEAADSPSSAASPAAGGAQLVQSYLVSAKYTNKHGNDGGGSGGVAPKVLGRSRTPSVASTTDPGGKFPPICRPGRVNSSRRSGHSLKAVAALDLDDENTAPLSSSSPGRMARPYNSARPSGRPGYGGGGAVAPLPPVIPGIPGGASGSPRDGGRGTSSCNNISKGRLVSSARAVGASGLSGRVSSGRAATTATPSPLGAGAGGSKSPGSSPGNGKSNAAHGGASGAGEQEDGPDWGHHLMDDVPAAVKARVHALQEEHGRMRHRTEHKQQVLEELQGDLAQMVLLEEEFGVDAGAALVRHLEDTERALLLRLGLAETLQMQHKTVVERLKHDNRSFDAVMEEAKERDGAAGAENEAERRIRRKAVKEAEATASKTKKAIQLVSAEAAERWRLIGQRREAASKLRADVARLEASEEAARRKGDSLGRAFVSTELSIKNLSSIQGRGVLYTLSPPPSSST